jgi:hypothetical protein
MNRHYGPVKICAVYLMNFDLADQPEKSQSTRHYSTQPATELPPIKEKKVLPLTRLELKHSL